MNFRSRLILFLAFGLGLVGAIVCAVAIIGLWSVNARLRNTTDVVFANVDDSFVVIQEQAKRTQDRVKASAITTESIASSLKNWTSARGRSTTRTTNRLVGEI